LNEVRKTVALMQQEASVIQSFEMAMQGKESAKQGRALMLFTIVTVILSAI